MRRPPRARTRRRVALYSHDTLGLGHIRRNIRIASALVAAGPDTDVLLLTGAPEATSLPLPPNTDVMTLPTVHKDSAGHYCARVLGLPLPELLRLRGRIALAALATFDPDLFVVDKVARGLHAELDPAVHALRTRATKVVLGLRDVLDSPHATRREWDADRTASTIADRYDQVWVYGDPAVYDAATAYGWPRPVRDKVVYTGYLAAGRTGDAPAGGPADTGAAPPTAPFVLCLVGGGQDGAQLADAFCASALPAGHEGVLITGPYMSDHQRRRLEQAARERSNLTVHGFTCRVAEFIGSAAAAVSMGGYNSVCELLAARCPALVVPRTAPRVEQALRADALARAGWLDCLPPDELSPARLTDWLAAAVTRPSTPHRPVDLNGLARLPGLADALLTDHPQEAIVHDAAV